MDIQNGKIIPKPQSQPRAVSKCTSSFDDDSDLSDDEEFFELTKCGSKKLDSEMDTAVASFIEKQKARRESVEDVKQGEGCQSWWQRRKDERAWRKGRKREKDGYVY